MTAIEHFLNGLRERFGSALTTLPGGAAEAVLRGRQRMTVTFDEVARTASITTPIEAATRELPAAMLTELLKRNFPDSRMAGSMLVAPPATDALAMINVIPLCSATPELLAGIAMAQAHAALDLSNEIVVRRRRESSDADADDEGDFDLDLFDEGEDDGEA